MKVYEQQCSEPVNNADGNYIIYQEQRYTAVVGKFILTPLFVKGGFSPMLSAEVIIQKDITKDLTFKVGHTLTAVGVGGESHNCQIHAIDGVFTEWRLQVVDQSQGA